MKIVDRFSTSPNEIAAMTVPGTLPRPPKTQIANTRPMNWRPTSGCNGSMTMMKEPASAALAQATPKAMRLMRTGERRNQPQRERILRHRDNGAADERLFQEQFKGDEHE
jgi:hypothetical protein